MLRIDNQEKNTFSTKFMGQRLNWLSEQFNLFEFSITINLIVSEVMFDRQRNLVTDKNIKTSLPGGGGGRERKKEVKEFIGIKK